MTDCIEELYSFRILLNQLNFEKFEDTKIELFVPTDKKYEDVEEILGLYSSKFFWRTFDLKQKSLLEISKHITSDNFIFIRHTCLFYEGTVALLEKESLKEFCTPHIYNRGDPERNSDIYSPHIPLCSLLDWAKEESTHEGRIMFGGPKPDFSADCRTIQGYCFYKHLKDYNDIAPSEDTIEEKDNMSLYLKRN